MKMCFSAIFLAQDSRRSPVPKVVSQTLKKKLKFWLIGLLVDVVRWSGTGNVFDTIL